MTKKKKPMLVYVYVNVTIIQGPNKIRKEIQTATRVLQQQTRVYTIWYHLNRIESRQVVNEFDRHNKKDLPSTQHSLRANNQISKHEITILNKGPDLGQAHLLAVGSNQFLYYSFLLLILSNITQLRQTRTFMLSVLQITESKV